MGKRRYRILIYRKVAAGVNVTSAVFLTMAHHFLVPIKTFRDPRNGERIFDLDGKIHKYSIEDEESFNKVVDMRAAFKNMDEELVLDEKIDEVINNASGYLQFWAMRSTAHVHTSIHHFTFECDVDDSTLETYVIHGMTDEQFDSSLVRRATCITT